MDRERIIILVDFENIHNFTVPTEKRYEMVVYIFVGAKQKNISINLIENILKNGKLEIRKSSFIGENSLDFGLAVEAGIIHSKEDKGSKFYILSKDKGFNLVTEYLKQYGRVAKRVENLDFLSGGDKTANREKQFYTHLKSIFANTNMVISQKENGFKNQVKSIFRNDNISEDEVSYIYKRAIQDGYTK